MKWTNCKLLHMADLYVCTSWGIASSSSQQSGSHRHSFVKTLCWCCRHLRDLLADVSRCDGLFFEHNGIVCDFSRQRVTTKTVQVSSKDTAA